MSVPPHRKTGLTFLSKQGCTRTKNPHKSNEVANVEGPKSLAELLWVPTRPESYRQQLQPKPVALDLLGTK